jgi:hypothetical protein
MSRLLEPKKLAQRPCPTQAARVIAAAHRMPAPVLDPILLSMVSRHHPAGAARAGTKEQYRYHCSTRR